MKPKTNLKANRQTRHNTRKVQKQKGADSNSKADSTLATQYLMYPVTTRIQKQESASHIGSTFGNNYLVRILKGSKTVDGLVLRQESSPKARVSDNSNFGVEYIPTNDVTQIREWEVQFNQVIQNRVASRMNSVAIQLLGSFQHYASWLRENQPEDVNYPIFSKIVDMAVTMACTALPAMSPLVKIAVTTAIGLVKDSVKDLVADSLKSDDSWETTRNQLSSQGAQLISEMTDSDLAQDFPGWLRQNLPEEYDVVHQDYRTRMYFPDYSASKITSEMNTWLTQLGIPDPQNRMIARELLIQLMTETRYAQIRESATSFMGKMFSNYEEYLYNRNSDELKNQLRGRAAREAYKRIPARIR